jgi:CheY-like chemotaxis protein
MFLQLRDILETNMAQILITGKDWTSRALLRAQLIEEGLGVEAYENVQAAVDRLWGSPDMPSLLVVDFFESTDQVEDLATLSHWAKLLPIWILAGYTTTEKGMLEGRGFERILFRPVDVGKLVQEIKQRLAE